MTKKDMTVVLNILKTAYPRFYQNLGANEIDDVINLWFVMLGDTDLETIKLALYKIIATSVYPPTIAELRNDIAKINKGEIEDAGEAWDKILKAIRKYGIYREQEALSTFSPSILACIRSLGGWRYICTSETIMADRAHFFKIFENIQKREQERRVIPEAINCKINNLIEMKK